MPIFKKLPREVEPAPLKPYGILIVDDELDILNSLSDMLSERYRVLTASRGEDALRMIEKSPKDTIHIILADQRMPEMSGVTFLERSLELLPEARRIVLTGYTDFQAAVHSINRCKVSNFLLKPFSREELLDTISKAVDEYEADKRKVKRIFSNELVGGNLKSFLEAYSEIPESDATVLIRGETGTGKELVAKAIHQNSKRRNKPFVTLHCGAIPETLFEAELFGHTRGAFTGAVSERKGRVMMAHGGTLFIDEVGEIPLSAQAKLLRFFQSGEYQRVGADDVGKADVRIITATHRDLLQMVKAGRFREDLYYRLRVLEINLPPLRERAGDIPELVAAFLKAQGGNGKSISRQAMMIMQGYHFPGNVRELQHCIERACALSATEEVGPHHLPPEILQDYGVNGSEEDFYNFSELTNEALKESRNRAVKKTAGKVERAFLKQLMGMFDTVSAAARQAGMARPYLHKLLTKHGMHWPG